MLMGAHVENTGKKWENVSGGQRKVERFTRRWGSLSSFEAFQFPNDWQLIVGDNYRLCLQQTRERNS
jgi:hypothetical protein